MTDKEIFAITKIAYASWGHIEITDELQVAYRLTLGDYEREEVLKAVTSCLSETDRRFPPTPPEILKAIKAARRSAAVKAEAARYNRIEYNETPVSKTTIARVKAMFPGLFESKRAA